MPVIAKHIHIDAQAKPAKLSYVYLHRLHQFNRLKPKSEKFSVKYQRALDAGLKDVKKDSWAAVPYSVWHFCGIKYYEKMMLSTGDKLGMLVPRLADEKKLLSFVEKQVDTRNLGLFQKASRFVKSIVIGGAAWAGVTAVTAFVLAELASSASAIVSGFSEPVAVATTIGIAAVSVALGYVARFKIDRARDMLEIGREKAQTLVSNVRKAAA